jgi:hypothetical protein
MADESGIHIFMAPLMAYAVKDLLAFPQQTLEWII